MNVVWKVARREVGARLLTKANVISLAIMVVAIVVSVVLTDHFRDREDEPLQVAAAPGVEALVPALEQAARAQGERVEVTTLQRPAAERELRGDLDAYLSGDAAAPEMLVEGQPGQTLLAVVSGAVQSYVLAQQVQGLGGDPAQVSRALAGAVPEVSSLEADQDQFGPAYAVAAASITLLMFSLIGTGSLIATGVVEEKTSRVVEILLATIRPSQLLAGKIVGIGVVGLVQVVLLGGVSVVAALATGVLDGLDVDLGAALALLVVWFVVGYLLFALLFGGFASLVSRQEDIGAVTTPLMLLIFAPYYLGLYLVTNDPDSGLVRVLSQVPFFAPFMMPVRAAYEAVRGWEVALSLLIAVAAVPVLVWVAGRVYQRGVLHTGGRMRLGEALRG